MDAVKFIKERNRMCKSFDGGCKGCPAFNACEDELCCAVGQESTLDATAQIAMVEEWSAAHQSKTRQDVFLEQWPNAARDMGGVVNICPKLLDVDISCTDDETERTGLCKDCDDCRREFWMQEVE